MPRRDRDKVFGFLIPATVLAFIAGFWPGIPMVIWGTLFWLTIGAWIFFAIRDRRRRKSSA